MPPPNAGLRRDFLRNKNRAARRLKNNGRGDENFIAILAGRDSPEWLVVPKPSWYGAMFQRALAAFGLHRARSGGFGAWLTSASG